MRTKSVLAAMAAILGATLAACGTTPGPATTVNCVGANLGSVTVTAGSTLQVTVVETVSLLDPGNPGVSNPLDNATGTIYADATGVTVATQTVKTDVNGVATFSFT